MIYLGIDPGISGALAFLCNGVVEFYDTPVLELKSGKTTKRFIDAPAAALMIEALRPDKVFIEKVQAMPGGGERSMGATSAFNFGMGFGVWLGILAALKIPYDMVHPATWKSKMMGGMTKEKDASRARAMQLYPGITNALGLKKHHNRADALLIATYGKQYGTNMPPHSDSLPLLQNLE